MIFNTLFDNIYVLNLKESIDRKLHIQTEFSRVGIEKYNFFEAVHYESDEVKNLMNSNFVKKFPNCFRCDKKRCTCENNFLTKFQIANWCSFINIFKDIINKNYNFVLLCEDDIVFSFQYERIINKLLSKESFVKYRINMSQPLLIRLGTAFNPNNHNLIIEPIFLKNFSLCNPCFAINKQMAIVYLYYLKIIDYHSDIYFHQKIPKNIKNVQYFTMHPYPVYELSFVKEKQKFNSLIRPPNEIRRIEYKEFLFLTSNLLLNTFVLNLSKKMNMDLKINSIGYNGNINFFILFNEKEKNRYYFENRILIIDNEDDDKKLIEKDIDYNKNSYYNLYLNKINEINNINITFENIDVFYKYYIKLNSNNMLKININNENDIKYLSKYVNINYINKEINKYKLIKNKILEKIINI